MSTLKVNTIQDRVGGNQSTASEIAQGRAKAWVEFSGQGSASIIGSYGVSSVSRASNGNYQVNFSSNFANTNYVVVCSSGANINTYADGLNIIKEKKLCLIPTREFFIHKIMELLRLSYQQIIVP
jgi:hypothetical protein